MKDFDFNRLNGVFFFFEVILIDSRSFKCKIWIMLKEICFVDDNVSQLWILIMLKEICWDQRDKGELSEDLDNVKGDLSK